MDLKGKQKPKIHGMIKHVINDDPTSFARDFREIVKEKISQKIIDRKNDIIQDTNLGITEAEDKNDNMVPDDVFEYIKGLVASKGKGGYPGVENPVAMLCSQYKDKNSEEGESLRKGYEDSKKSKKK